MKFLCLKPLGCLAIFLAVSRASIERFWCECFDVCCLRPVVWVLISGGHHCDLGGCGVGFCTESGGSCFSTSFGFSNGLCFFCMVVAGGGTMAVRFGF